MIKVQLTKTIINIEKKCKISQFIKIAKLNKTGC